MGTIRYAEAPPFPGDNIYQLSALVLTDVMLSLTSNPCRRLNGPLQRVHRLRGQRDHVPRVHPPPLHTEQQVKNLYLLM